VEESYLGFFGSAYDNSIQPSMALSFTFSWPFLEGIVLYSNQAKIAVQYVYLVDDLLGRYRIFVPELFPIVPQAVPKGNQKSNKERRLVRGNSAIMKLGVNRLTPSIT
jgi:hypothetical protein